MMVDDKNETNGKSPHVQESFEHNYDYRIRGFFIAFLSMFILTFRSCERGFTGSWGTDYFSLLILSLIIGIMFGAFGLIIGKNIKSSKPVNDYGRIKQFFTSKLGKIVSLGLLLSVLLVYFFGRQKNPFSNGSCISDLRNDIQCKNFLQGEWYYKKGSNYNYDAYYVEVDDNTIIFKRMDSENENWEVVNEGEIGFDEYVESYWCCTRSVRAVTINGKPTFLYVSQSENGQGSDYCGGFAFDGYTGRDIVSNSDFFKRVD